MQYVRITVIGGLLFSTLLTLILVPVVYDIVENLSGKGKEFDGRPRPPPD